MKILHIALIISNKEQSLKFYTENLGLKKIAGNYRADRNSYKIDLKRNALGNVYFSRVSLPEALAFELGDIVGYHARLKVQKIEVQKIRVDEYTGKKFYFFPDPDGLPIEIYEA